MSADDFTSVLDALLGIAFTIHVTVSGFMGDARRSMGRHEKPLTIVMAFICMPAFRDFFHCQVIMCRSYHARVEKNGQAVLAYIRNTGFKTLPPGGTID